MVKKRRTKGITKVCLRGRIVAKPVLLYEKNGEIFFKTTIKVARGEDAEDEIALLMPKEYAEAISEGDFVEVKGSAFPYETKCGDLTLGVMVNLFEKVENEEDLNEIIVVGYLKKKKVEIISDSISYANVMLNVKGIDEKNFNIGCVTWDKLVANDIKRLKKGAFAEIKGCITNKAYPERPIINISKIKSW